MVGLTYIAARCCIQTAKCVTVSETSSESGVISYCVINPDLPEASNTTTWSRPWQVHPTCSAPNTNKSSYIQVWLHTYSLVYVCSISIHMLRFFVRIHFRRLLLPLRNLNIILIFLLIIRIFVNVIFQVIKIELKIAMRKKHINIIPTRKVNMYSNLPIA